jgi:regulatory protein
MPADRSRPRRKARPLDPARLEELALVYVARFAASAAKVESYLIRKIRERGWEADKPADPAALVEKFVAAGYIDDEAYARAKSGGLLRRGYGPRRVDQALGAAGIAPELREDVRAGEGEERRAAVAFAARRRLGPWSREPSLRDDRDARQKQFAAMVRAGHGFDAARAVIEANTVAAAEEWAAEAEEQ